MFYGINIGLLVKRKKSSLQKIQLDEPPQKRYYVRDARVMHSHQLDSTDSKHRVGGAI